MKLRSDAKLLNLPEEQQAQLADWLLSGMPYHVARATVETEFGVRVALSAFTQFWNEVCAGAYIQHAGGEVSIPRSGLPSSARPNGRRPPDTWKSFNPSFGFTVIGTAE